MGVHDRRLKTLLRELLQELLGLRFPTWRTRFDFARVQWLEQEVFIDPPHGERREMDLVARVPVFEPMEESNEALIHIEVESGDSVADLRPRMPGYRNTLRIRHGLPVLSLGLYLDVGFQGMGWDETVEQCWGETVSLTRWAYLGLPALDARTHVEGDNLLGVALSVLMAIGADQQGWLKARALQRVSAAAMTPYRRHLLMEFIEAYLPLEGPHLEQYRQLLLTEDFKMARNLGKTSFELGMEQGRTAGQRASLRDQLEAKFGTLSETATQRLEAMSADRLRQLGRELLQNLSLVNLGLEDAPDDTRNGA
jgi:hypothetical protein